jgi:hypothetical protein
VKIAQQSLLLWFYCSGNVALKSRHSGAFPAKANLSVGSPTLAACAAKKAASPPRRARTRSDTR